jgi:DUF4097 and DUF4098 domain-containing protein YvlB
MIRFSIRTISSVLLLALFMMPAKAQETHRTFDVKAGDRLELDLDTGGDIVITGWDKNQVDITINIEGRDREDVVVDMEANSRGVEVSTEFKSRRSRADVNMTIRVPRKFNLEVSTTGGDVQIENVDGKTEGSSMGGDIVLRGLSGNVDFTTMGGDISLSDSQVNGSLHTMGGDVSITDVTGSVEGTTMGGDVTYDNVKSGAGSSDEEVKISTMGGDVNVDEALYGANLHTMGGDIEVQKAGKYVKATTMGGEILVHAIDGWIEANTMGGDIEVTMIGGTDGDRHVQLESMGGTVELTVPSGLSMKFDIEINLSREADEDEYEIISDFDMNVEMDRSGDDSRWKSGRTIHGEGSVGGGRNLIKIRTTNGDVVIKRAK